MSEVVQSQNRTALEKALILLIGKELAIDPYLGLATFLDLLMQSKQTHRLL
ncbi:MAG: hypothetical protein IPM42_22240 [Saprospiraceae bacterium]|nr:hypothetical protein [Saprospiraceae bacterium]